MQLVERVSSEFKELIRKNITEYEADADKLKKNAKRTLIGLGTYLLLRWAGPDSNALLETMTYIAENAALVYTVVRGYQTVRDFVNYL